MYGVYDWVHGTTNPGFAKLAELHGKLATWEDDWNAPGMEAYDDL